ncbi:MAG: 7-cyano-7-deazaguanine synthase [Phycisphaerales bacterium]|nr:7-cyano-7-deazaguanine synthase [Phycisphaerales bacterium]
MAKEKAVVLCSGGLNSAVSATIAATEHTLAFLHVRFEHRAASHEAELFEKQTAYFGAEQQLAVNMPHLAAIGGNARLNTEWQIEKVMNIGEGRPGSYIPGLVGTLLNVGFTWASVIGASKVFLGVSEDLGPPAPRLNGMYPDYSREYIELCRHAFSIATPDKPISIEIPVIDLTRTETVKLGVRLGTPFELTWSCISSGTEPCGVCVGCATRNRGFLDAAIPDPILCEPASTTLPA